MKDTQDNRIIFHIDVNSAFLSWSAVKRLSEDPNAPDLRLIPSAVGGDVKTRHGVITAKSIPAKKFGVKTGEPVMRALEKCPELVLIPSDFTTYRKYSNAFMKILKKYCPAVEKASIDEAYLDMTGLEDRFQRELNAGGTFPRCAAELSKNEIRDTIGFTVNVGISSNKLLAKMASDFTKPDKIHTLYPEEVPEKLWPLPIGELYGCGPKTAERLTGLGLKTIGDAAKADPDLLISILGDKAGSYIHRAANGLSRSEVAITREKAKSYSNETTTPEDITLENFDSACVPTIKMLSGRVAERLQRDRVRGSTVFISVKTALFRRHSRQMRIDNPTNDAGRITESALLLASELLMPPSGLFAHGEAIRLVGVGVTTLTESTFDQLDLFSWAEEKKKNDAAAQKRKARDDKLTGMMQKINDKYGSGAISRGQKGFKNENTDHPAR
ncbi:MAG: DNA polymerase IV [Lachnospiraceae bacterium]|nr:DNA polymerase IV [Lachnospiraceae bacterium]